MLFSTKIKVSAGGAARTKRKREEQVSVPTLVKMFKQVINSSEGFDLTAVHNGLSKVSKPKRNRKRKQSNPKPPAPQQEEQVWKQQRYAVCPQSGWWVWLGPQEQPVRYVQLSAKDHWAEEWPSLLKQQPKVVNKPQQLLVIRNLCLSDWKTTPAPKLCSPQQAMSALEHGETPPGNVVEIRQQLFSRDLKIPGPLLGTREP
eukprot:Skav229239  [mRNA]  locus=scaffold2154:134227:134832:+ [translate_table: standard]